MQPDIAVVGGGLLGRLLAWRASRAGVRVALYDAGGRLGENSAAWAAAGMITPTVESAGASSDVVAMGRHSLSLWPQWLAELPLPVFSRDNGSLVLWHEDDAGEASRFQAAVAASDAHADVRAVDGPQLHALEPLLDGRFSQALYVPDEWQIDNRELLQAVAAALEVERVECHWKTHIADGAFPAAEVIVDCRGMGARAGWPQLRGVRGEIVRLHAPGIALRHMLRLLHPRSPIYVVPRGEGKLVVGATSIESDDRSPVSVGGALALLSSACSILPGLNEARILEFTTQVRPALPGNVPAFRYDAEQSVLRINGLYRHGFLLSPAVVEEALAFLLARDRPGFLGRWPCLRAPDEDAAVGMEPVAALSAQKI